MDMVNKFQMICLNATKVIQRKPNAGCIDGYG